MTLVLASGSASRRAILKSAGVRFIVIPADLDEDFEKDRLLRQGVAADDVAQHLAGAKAQSVSRLQPAALVLGADQALLLDDELVSKCPDLSSARALLLRLRGRRHRLVSSLVLVRDGRALWLHKAHAALTMRDFSDAFLDAYLSTEGEGVLGGVGCYKLEGLGAQLFESVEGDYFSILGLPLQPLLAELRRQGVTAT
jgi:septum formation protein